MLQRLTDETFKSYINKEACVVLFKADWCIPSCRMMRAYSDIEATKTFDEPMYVLDVDESPITVMEQDVRATPFIGLYIDGALVDYKVGEMTLDDIKIFVGPFEGVT